MDEQTVAGYWDGNAAAWVEGVRAGYDVYREYVNNPAFFGMLPDVAGLRILDVGCGEGYNTRLLADRGARMVGVDISERMIAAAVEHEEQSPRSIDYHLRSGSDLSLFEDDSFDAVISTMAMMDMPCYEACVDEVSRVLKSGGLFQFSISHPCVMTRAWQWLKDEKGQRQSVAVGNYFSLEATTAEEDVDQWHFTVLPKEQRQRTPRFRVPRFFRTMSEYYNAIVNAGLTVTQMAEPYADDETVAQCPDVADTRIVPYFLIFQCRKEVV